MTFHQHMIATAQSTLADARSKLKRAKAARDKAQDALNVASADVAKYTQITSDAAAFLKGYDANTKGFAPMNPPPSKVETSAPQYGTMTVREGVRAFFMNNENQPTHYKVIASITGYKAGTVYKYLKEGGYIRTKKGTYRANTSEETEYSKVTVRAGLRMFFLNNENQPTKLADLCEATNYRRSTVRQYLSAYPEFINGPIGSWSLCQDYYTQGHTTVGR